MGTSYGAAACRRTVRRGWDSNPRYPCEYNSLAGSPIRPLSHLSRWCMSRRCIARSGGCGEGGIRTPGAPWLNGFQDRLLRPLGHLSEAQTRYPSARIYVPLPRLSIRLTSIPGHAGTPLTVALGRAPPGRLPRMARRAPCSSNAHIVPESRAAFRACRGSLCRQSAKREMNAGSVRHFLQGAAPASGRRGLCPGTPGTTPAGCRARSPITGTTNAKVRAGRARRASCKWRKMRHPHTLRRSTRGAPDRLQRGSQIAILLQNLRWLGRLFPAPGRARVRKPPSGLGYSWTWRL